MAMSAEHRLKFAAQNENDSLKTSGTPNKQTKDKQRCTEDIF